MSVADTERETILLDSEAVDVEDEVLVAKAGRGRRTALDDLHDLDAEAAVEVIGRPRRERPAPTGDAQIGAAEAAVAHEGGDDSAGRGVHRHGQAQADTGDRRVHAHQPPLAVDEGAARVAGVEGGVGLDDVLHDAAGGPGPGGEGATEGADHAGGDGAGQAHGVADGDHKLADAQHGGVPELGRQQVRALGPHDGEVGKGVAAHDLDVELAPVGEGGDAALGALDHVGRSNEKAVGGDGDR